jgi:transposase
VSACRKSIVDTSTASQLIADLPELGKLNRQEIAALVGLAAMNRDSGMTRGRRSIFRGGAAVRCALYMAAFSAMRFNEIIRRFAERLRAAGKPLKVTVVAAMRKLLTILNVIAQREPAVASATKTLDA